jgi:hypothetical protein
MTISPDEDDVLLMKAAAGIVSSDTFRVEALHKGINQRIEYLWNQARHSHGVWKQWLDGLPCQLLSAKTGGWQKGTIRMVIKISFEFTPDENKVTPEAGKQEYRATGEVSPYEKGMDGGFALLGDPR